MKYKIILIILTLISCKTESKKSVDVSIESNKIENEKKINCALSALKKTIDYKNELKKYAEINSDTLIELEKKKIGIENYRTVFKITEFDQNLWLLIDKNNKIDSILIQHEDFVEYLFTVESKFDIDKCEITRIETKYSMNDESQETEIKTIKI